MDVQIVKKKNTCLNKQLPIPLRGRRLAWICLFLWMAVGCGTINEDNTSSDFNVLMICVDDLRPELGCYGNPIVQTPHIDRLASTGFLFKNHYVQSAICGPSRSTLLTGKMSQEWDPWLELRKTNTSPARPVALPHLLQQQGYKTIGIGKITHWPGGVMDEAQEVPQIPFSWDTTYTVVDKWATPWRAFFAYANGDAHNTAMRIGMDTPHLPYEMGAVDDLGYPDGLNAREAIKQLQILKKEEVPFFLALGFYKPHLPFNAPKKYWDLYDRDKIPMAKNNFVPEHLDNNFSINKSPEVTTHYPWPDGPGVVSMESAKILKHGYYACVSYIDALVGEVLDELKRLNLDQNTIVVLWSDHGWQLGEHTMFGKMSNFDMATNSPLIIRVPGLEDHGRQIDGLVETLDVYPTIAELCGLAYPDDLDGMSMTKLLHDPMHEGKPYARSFYYRNGALGKTIKTEQYRMVRWADEKDSTLAVELYDHHHDPNENINLASQQKTITDSLLALLKPMKFLGPEAPFVYGWE